MKRFLLILSFCFFAASSAKANHITGGEIYYTLVSQAGNSYSYHVTLKLFRDCASPGAQLDISAPIAIFDMSGGGMVWTQLVARTQVVTLSLGSPDPCISNPPSVCYEVGYYEFDVTLPGTANGYIISYQRCCRISGINNLQGSNNVGATYTAMIPGTSLLATAPANSSAKFIGRDTVIVCAANIFNYSFAAEDADGDLLVYSFCDAYLGGSPGAPAPNPPAAPFYTPVPYNPPFTASSPLGSGVTINNNTGLISGIAPDAGIYVVTVCVSEIRNGVVIAVQRKDLQIKVGNCNIASVTLDPQYITCDGFSWTFFNGGSQALINSYSWFFGDPGSGPNDSSILATPTHIFSDTGEFIVTLITNRNDQCSDTGTTIMKVYPGFFPGFRTVGTCINFPIQFFDTTRTNYGVVNTWNWNFGDITSVIDTSRLQNPSWQYSTSGPKDVVFIVSNSKGCLDTVRQTVDVLDKPVVNLAFRDTLICRGDVLQLQASGAGVFSWTPLVNIVNANTPTPLVNPVATTWYKVNLNESGCINNDSVRVRVVNDVTLRAINDTTICQNDAIQLGANSDGLQFNWTPVANLDNPSIINPIAITPNTTTYNITATIGGCTATDQVIVATVPYPGSNAGPDTIICYNTAAQLNGSIAGSSFSWSPAIYLNSTGVLNPVAAPPRTFTYILTVFDTLGCPKPGRDTVIVNVLPRIRPFAGRDTAVVVGQPLQFNGHGGTGYQWSPGIGLSNINIANPVGVYDGSIDSIRYKLVVNDEAGCVDSAYVTVRVFKTNPSVFVPTAFTPNNDGRNDIIRPIAVGIKKINYFSIYNRWGQLVFTTTINGLGWDGRIAGVPQGTNTYVWMVSAVDYVDRPFFMKGTTTLIR